MPRPPRGPLLQASRGTLVRLQMGLAGETLQWPISPAPQNPALRLPPCGSQTHQPCSGSCPQSTRVWPFQLRAHQSSRETAGVFRRRWRQGEARGDQGPGDGQPLPPRVLAALPPPAARALGQGPWDSRGVPSCALAPPGRRHGSQALKGPSANCVINPRGTPRALCLKLAPEDFKTRQISTAAGKAGCRWSQRSPVHGTPQHSGVLASRPTCSAVRVSHTTSPDFCIIIISYH